MRYLLIIMLAISQIGFGQKKLSWSILHPIKKEWIELGEKGSVQEALIATGELPDPFYGMNENKFGWIEDHQWEFKSIFFLEKEELKREFIDLHIPSLDTYAKIFLNDSLIYTGDNAFIEHTIRLKNHLKKGLNELTIVFTPPVMYHKTMYENASYHLPAPNDNHFIAIAPYTRKPQYQFGWDWALRMNTIGLNKTAWIDFSNFGHVNSKTTRIISVSDDKAIIEFDIDLSDENVSEIIWESERFGTEKVKRRKGVFTRRVQVDNPKLWWPQGQGEAFLYIDKVEIQTIKNQHIDSYDLKFGIKTSELVMEKDEWGTSYYFKINGRIIFCKGGDYIPQDIFPARVKDEDVERMVELMAESNFNMVRVWGGGYYPDEVFFDKCDELGVMVWEDLMFACAMYPGDDAFIENISKEFRLQIPRIAAHPSVVLFNGNNEVEVAWGNWGFQIKYGLFGKSAKEIEHSYDRVFKETAPDIIKEFTNLPYIHTSPLSNWGKDDLYNHGSQHYWGVWHGKDPMEDFGKKIGRFNAEYGFQSFPEYNTLLTFSDTTQWDLSSDVMKHHQKSYVGNDMIMKHAKGLYGKPENFEDFVYYSQLTQAKAVSMAIAGHRIDFPRCGGTLYWQVNDCWPAPTWASVDYNWNWKALQYEVKKDYENVAVVAKYDDLENRSYYIVNDLPDNYTSNIHVQLIDLEGKTVKEWNDDAWFTGAGSKMIAFDEKSIEEMTKSNLLVKFTWNNATGEKLTRNFANIKSDYKSAKADDITLSIEAIDSVAKTAVISVENKRFVRDFWLTSNKFGVKFKSNFLNLVPGEHLIDVSFDEIPKVEELRMKWL
ncbi:MAG: hypothetical protein QNL61_05080 [Crocinitomicaceae bacterium]